MGDFLAVSVKELVKMSVSQGLTDASNESAVTVNSDLTVNYNGSYELILLQTMVGN